MSTYYWEKKQRSQNIPITSIRCLVEALTTSSIQLTNVPVEVHSLIHAEQSYAEALDAYERSSLTSLEDVKLMQTNIESLIAANETLHEALIKAEQNLPNSLNFTQQGVSYTAKRAAGSYRITWTEEVQKYDGDHRETGLVRGGDGAREFVHTLCRAYEGAQLRHQNERNRLKTAMAELRSELPDALDQAIRVRTAWERAEEAKRVKNLVNERKEHVLSRGESMGFTSHVTEIDVDEEQRIIVSMERFAPTSSGESDQGHSLSGLQRR